MNLLYQPAKREGYINLADNENPYDIPINLKYKLQQAILELNFASYPDPYADRLREKLTLYLGVKKDNIFVGNGSDELIFLLILASGAEVVISPHPTFPIYELSTKLLRRNYIKIPLKEDSWELNFKDYKKEYTKNSLTFISYPNNPTGNCIRRDVIEKIIKHSYPNWIVVDEAYYEFCNRTFLNYINEYSNLVILRSFSKAFSFAGLRIGYMIGNKDIVAKLFSSKLPYNTNSFSLKAAEIILDSKEELKVNIERVKKERNFIFKFLNTLDFVKPYPSFANFILFYSELVEKIYNHLLDKGIIIRKFDIPPLEGKYLRVTIGKREDNAKFCSNLLNVKV